MRYAVVPGVLTLFLAAGLIQAGDALGQQPRAELVPVRSNQGVVYQKFHEAEAETNEMTQLNALDAQLGQQAEALVKQLAEATDEKDRAKLKESLQDTLTQQFDTQQKVRELEVASIEARVKKLRDIIAKRNDARRTIIDKRLDQLVREAEGLGWNSPAGGPAVYAPALPGAQIRGGFGTFQGQPLPRLKQFRN